MDELDKYLDEFGFETAQIAKLNNFVIDEEYDTESILEDVEDYPNQSNISSIVKDDIAEKVYQFANVLQSMLDAKIFLF